MKKRIWKLLPVVLRDLILKRYYIDNGMLPVSKTKSVHAWHIKGVHDDLKKKTIFKKRTGYDQDGVYEYFWTKYYAQTAPSYDIVIDIGSGPGVQLLSVMKHSDSFRDKFTIGSNLLPFEPSLKYSEIFRINHGEYPLRYFVVSQRNMQFSLYNIYQRHVSGMSAFIKMDIEGYEFELLHELASDENYDRIEVLCEFHINKIKLRGYDPHYLLDYIGQRTEIRYNLHHDALRKYGKVDNNWDLKRPDLNNLDTIAINFNL